MVSIITQTQIAKAIAQFKTAEKEEQFLTDATGLQVYLRRTNKGVSVRYYFRSRVGGKATRRMIGVYPDMTITEARARHLELKKEYESGQVLPSHKEQKAAQKEEIEERTAAQAAKDSRATFGQLWDERVTMKEKEVKIKTLLTLTSIYNNHISKLANVPVEDIDAQFMLKFLEPYIAENKLQIVNKICMYVNEILNFGVFKGVIKYNPIISITSFLPSHKTRHNPAFSDETLKEDMIKLFEDFKNETPMIQAFLHMLFYTLLRSNEVRSLTMDMPQGDYVITPTKTMTDFKAVLTPPAQSIIEWAKAQEHKSDFIFERFGKKINANTLNKILSYRGYEGKLTTHGIRTCGRQFLQTLPYVKESIIEMCLSHVVGGAVQQAYNRGQYFEERQKAMLAWSEFVTECIGDNNEFYKNF